MSLTPRNYPFYSYFDTFLNIVFFSLARNKHSITSYVKEIRLKFRLKSVTNWLKIEFNVIFSLIVFTPDRWRFD
jgi:hypothetical protein